MDFLSDLLRYPFLQYAVWAALLAAVAAGPVGSLVVARRSTYIAGTIAHCVLGGMGLARYLDRVWGWQWATPLFGATAAALAAALLIALCGRSRAIRQDTLLSALWAVGMALGILFIHCTPGYQEDLMSYLFGNILMIGPADLWLMLGLDVLILGTVWTFRDRFLAIAFQGELAELRGIPVARWEALLLMLIALTVVLLIQIVGLVLVIALLSLPAAAALRMTRRLQHAMWLGSVGALLCMLGGLVASYRAEWPPGATMVLCAGGWYLLVVVAGLCRHSTGS